MRNPETIDVIIPCKNGQKWLEGALESIYSQTLLPSRVLIIDDHSTEPMTLEGFNCEFKIDTEIVISKGQGLSAARNTGIELSRSEYLAFLDVDDRWDQRKIEKQVDMFRKFPTDAANYCEYFSVDIHGRIIGTHSWRHLLSTTEGLIAEQTPVLGSASSIMVKRHAIINAGGFDEQLNYAEDLDCWIRISKIGKIRKVPLGLVFITENPESMQRSITASDKYHLEIKSKMRIYEKHQDFLDLGLANIIETLNMALLRRTFTPRDIYSYLQELAKIGLLERDRFSEFFIFLLGSFCRVLFRGLRYKSKALLSSFPPLKFIWKLIKYGKFKMVHLVLKKRSK